MELEHRFTVAVPVERAWEVLLDLERVAPCMPGATLTSYDGEQFAGNVRVKLGPVTMTFAGQGRFVERDEQARRMVIEASGKDKRGGGTARATVRSVLHDEGGSTVVEVHTDMVVTGRAAQFGRGMIADVSTRLLGQFTDCLAGELGAPAQPADTEAQPAGTEGQPVDTEAQPSGAGTEPSAPAATPPGDQPPAATSPVAPPPAAPPPATTPAAARPPAGTPAQPATRGQPAARAQAEPIDLLGVTGMRAAAGRLVPYLVVFLVGALLGGGLVALLTG